MRVGYVLKRYPRYSETFIVNEILAHEAAGLEIEIFALRPPLDTHFQDAIARVRAPVHYVSNDGVKATKMWDELRSAREVLPGLRASIDESLDEDGLAVRQALLLALEARSRGVEHLHAHFGTVATTVARLAGRFAELPYTFTAHAKDIFHESVEPDDLARKVRDAAAVVTVSNYNLAHLRSEYPAEAGKIQRIYNGLHLDRFQYAEPQRRSPLIVAVGRLVEKKGFGVLVEACRILADRGRDFRCRIVGSGDLADALSARIRELDVGRFVELAGPRPQAEIIDEIQEAAVHAAPCIVGSDGNRDGLPTTLLEAMALGTPCVSTDVTGIPEVVREGETGLVVPQGDATALAGALERLLEDPTLRTQLASRARRLIEAEFEIHRNAGRLREIFEAGTRTDSSLSRAVG